MGKYEQFGIEWENEMKKLPKEELIKMIRKIQTGTENKNFVFVQTSRQASAIAEGIINDFESGVSTKKETMAMMGEYTGRLMQIFWEVALEKIKNDPTILTKNK